MHKETKQGNGDGGNGIPADSPTSNYRGLEPTALLRLPLDTPVKIRGYAITLIEKLIAETESTNDAIVSNTPPTTLIKWNSEVKKLIAAINLPQGARLKLPNIMDLDDSELKLITGFLTSIDNSNANLNKKNLKDLIDTLIKQGDNNQSKSDPVADWLSFISKVICYLTALWQLLPFSGNLRRYQEATVAVHGEFLKKNNHSICSLEEQPDTGLFNLPGCSGVETMELILAFAEVYRPTMIGVLFAQIYTGGIRLIIIPPYKLYRYIYPEREVKCNECCTLPPSLKKTGHRFLNISGFIFPTITVIIAGTTLIMMLNALAQPEVCNSVTDAVVALNCQTPWINGPLGDYKVTSHSSHTPSIYQALPLVSANKALCYRIPNTTDPKSLAAILDIIHLFDPALNLTVKNLEHLGKMMHKGLDDCLVLSTAFNPASLGIKYAAAGLVEITYGYGNLIRLFTYGLPATILLTLISLSCLPPLDHIYLHAKKIGEICRESIGSALATAPLQFAFFFFYVAFPSRTNIFDNKYSEDDLWSYFIETGQRTFSGKPSNPHSEITYTMLGFFQMQIYLPIVILLLTMTVTLTAAKMIHEYRKSLSSIVNAISTYMSKISNYVFSQRNKFIAMALTSIVLTDIPVNLLSLFTSCNISLAQVISHINCGPSSTPPEPYPPNSTFHHGPIRSQPNHTTYEDLLCDSKIVVDVNYYYFIVVILSAIITTLICIPIDVCDCCENPIENNNENRESSNYQKIEDDENTTGKQSLCHKICSFFNPCTPPCLNRKPQGETLAAVV